MTKKYMLTNWFFCHCTSTEVTNHRQFGKRVRYPIFRLRRKILSFLFKQKVLIFENINISKSIFGNYLEPRKERKRITWSKPLQTCWTGH